MKFCSSAEVLHFDGTAGEDIYNITAPFTLSPDALPDSDSDAQPSQPNSSPPALLIAGRVEARDSEQSRIVLFEKSPSEPHWRPSKQLSTDKLVGLQDPCVTKLRNKLVIGGVRYPHQQSDGGTTWRMEFYQQANGQFTPLFNGPDGMKDIRLLELPDQRILTLTRPQGERGGRGRIGFFIADNVAQISHAAINSAPLIHFPCGKNEWVGANEAHLITPNTIGILGHIASFCSKGKRHYRAITFMLDIFSGEVSSPREIAQRSDFPPGPSKRPDLEDVIFPGGLIRYGQRRALLFAGLSDCTAGYLDIPDPFTSNASNAFHPSPAPSPAPSPSSKSVPPNL